MTEPKDPKEIRPNADEPPVPGDGPADGREPGAEPGPVEPDRDESDPVDGEAPAARAAEPESVSDTEASPDPETTEEPVSGEETPESESEEDDRSDNFHHRSKEELLALAEQFCEEPDYAAVRARVNPLREAFDELVAAEQEAALEQFLEDGGERKDFEYKKGDTEKRFARAMRKLNKKRNEFIEAQERQRTENLKAKQEILGQLKELIQNEDNLSRAFNTFHELQARWRETGPVPQNEVKDLWLTYKTFTDQFYNFIRLNKELQDLDHKKNLEIKIGLCEQIEELMLEPSINKAMQKLMAIQNTWREIGSVPRDRREEIGERYKEGCRKVYDRRKEHTRDVKTRQQENAAMKAALCEKVKSFDLGPAPAHKDVMEAMQRVRDWQREWRTIGFAGPGQHEELWKEFREACNAVYKAKNEFFNEQRKSWDANLQAKTELCIQAEALSKSTDWKKAGAELRRLHEQWKKTGFSGPKQSDDIWKRFRAASDAFYETRRKHFKDIDAEYGTNLEKKQKLVADIEQCALGEDRKENLERIRGFQRQWSEIGMVPIKKKDAIFTAYRKAVDGLFEKMGVAKAERDALQYKERIEHLKTTSDGGKRMHAEKKAISYKLSQLENEVTTWENNLGFFAKSKNAESIIKDFETKIHKAKSQIDKLRQQLDLIKKNSSKP